VQASIAHGIVGVWRLISFETDRAGDPVRHPFGRDALGLLVYTAAGYMSGQLMRPDRPRFGAATITAGSDAALRAAASGYVAYAGTYDVDEHARVVTHHVTMSLFPDLVGTDQRRLVELDGDRLALRTPPENGRVSTLRWQRASPRVDRGAR
jgi:lipocalin-like protein